MTTSDMQITMNKTTFEDMEKKIDTLQKIVDDKTLLRITKSFGMTGCVDITYCSGIDRDEVLEEILEKNKRLNERLEASYDSLKELQQKSELDKNKLTRELLRANEKIRMYEEGHRNKILQEITDREINKPWYKFW